ncbi:MAG: putative anti-sigma regulatory factor, serine/threonine protein kinase [Solirubrobacterales bacterium]|nr:putative anti-sigma regulatory factor, serine/threonine protein kinase [Solirubrobacterales bacterium]
MAEIPNVHLSLPSRPENVLIVRQALGGLATCLALDAIESNDLNTAVTEACNNVVMHAYGEREGALEVDAYALSDSIAVVVRDHGRGMPPQGEEKREEGIGLAVIDALARQVEFARTPGGGTELRMEFDVPEASTIEPIAGEGLETFAAARAGLTGVVELRLAPNAIARAVLPRVLSALAARAYFTTDRISDVQIVADVLATNAGESIRGTYLDIGVTVAPRKLELLIGPLLTGRGESLMTAAADGSAPVIERLTDAQRVAPFGSGETLELHLADHR